MNIYDLGLIYTTDIAENGNIDINMSLPHRVVSLPERCPMVARAVSGIDGTGWSR